jgi:hypothetical protein
LRQWRIGIAGVAAAAMSILVGGCAGFAPFSAPGRDAATIVEKNVVQSRDVAQIFHVAAIDGVPVESSYEATRRASAGQPAMVVLPYEHRVPARPLRLTLVGTLLASSPSREDALRREGEFLRIEGDVSFTPAPGGAYFVAGELKKSGSSVWIADLATGQPRSARVTAAH